MKKVLAVLLAAIFALSCLSGCREQPLLDPHDPVVLTLWHTYGEQADSPMNRLIDRFNSTVGMERGVVIRTTLITVAAKISDRLAEAQDGTPGAVPLPDLFFCHNNDAAGFGVDRLLDWNDYFTGAETPPLSPISLPTAWWTGGSRYCPCPNPRTCCTSAAANLTAFPRRPA